MEWIDLLKEAKAQGISLEDVTRVISQLKEDE